MNGNISVTGQMISLIRKQIPVMIAQQIVGVQPIPSQAGSVFKRDIMVGGHTFNQRYWPYVKMVLWNQYFDAERWCYQNFKSRNWRSQGQYFAFKRKEDYTFFMLRWE